MSRSGRRFSAQATARAIERALEAHANPERVAVLSGGYAPSRLRYIGASVPDLRGVVREVGTKLRTGRKAG